MVTRLSETTGKLSNKVRSTVSIVGKNDTTITLAKDYIAWYNTPGFPGSNSDKDKEGRAIWSRCDALLAAHNAANASVGGTDDLLEWAASNTASNSKLSSDEPANEPHRPLYEPPNNIPNNVPNNVQQPTQPTLVSKPELVAYTTGMVVRTGSIAAGKAISRAAKTTGKVLNAFVKGLTAK